MVNDALARAWVEQQIGGVAPVGDGIEWRPIPARRAELFLVRALGPPFHEYFVKRYQPAGGTEWGEHAMHLERVARAQPGARPVVLAASAEHGVLVSRAVSGRPIRALHRFASAWRPRRRDLLDAWNHAGRWLAELHAIPLPPSTADACADQMLDIAVSRFQRWEAADSAAAALAPQAIAAARRLRVALAPDARVGLCHGDVSSGNILVEAGAVCLVDYDDLRVDLPGLDCSQAMLELAELTRSTDDAGLCAAGRAAFVEGYGPGYPVSAAYWLPQLRNLAVFLSTLAPPPSTLARWSTGGRYRRTIIALRRTLAAITAGDASERAPDR